MPKKNPATGDPILDALRAERERRGWSQTDLAQRIGRLTYNTAYQWESGINEPTLSSLREWAGALGFDVTLTALVPVSGGTVETSTTPAAEEDHRPTHHDFKVLAGIARADGKPKRRPHDPGQLIEDDTTEDGAR